GVEGGMRVSSVTVVQTCALTILKIYQLADTSGQPLYFDGKGSDSGGNWYLYGPNDAQVPGGAANLVNDFEVTLSSAGNYVLVVRDRKSVVEGKSDGNVRVDDSEM